MREHPPILPTGRTERLRPANSGPAGTFLRLAYWPSQADVRQMLPAQTQNWGLHLEASVQRLLLSEARRCRSIPGVHRVLVQRSAATDVQRLQKVVNAARLLQGAGPNFV